MTLCVGLTKNFLSEILYLKMVTVLAVTFLQLGCSPSEPLPKECEEFFHKNAAQKEKEFPTYDFDTQLTLHFCALNDSPPTGIYSYNIAERGKAIIPRLLKKLNNTGFKAQYRDETMKLAVFLVFERLAETGQLDEDPQTLKIFDDTVSQMKLSWIKRDATESLNKIKQLAQQNKL